MHFSLAKDLDTVPFGNLTTKSGRTGASHGALALAHFPCQSQRLVIPQGGAASLGIGLGKGETGKPLLQSATLLRWNRNCQAIFTKLDWRKRRIQERKIGIRSREDLSLSLSLSLLLLTSCKRLDSKSLSCCWKPTFGFAMERPTLTTLSASFHDKFVMLMMYATATVTLLDIPARLRESLSLKAAITNRDFHANSKLFCTVKARPRTILLANVRIQSRKESYDF